MAAERSGRRRITPTAPPSRTSTFQPKLSFFLYIRVHPRTLSRTGFLELSVVSCRLPSFLRRGVLDNPTRGASVWIPEIEGAAANYGRLAVFSPPFPRDDLFNALRCHTARVTCLFGLVIGIVNILRRVLTKGTPTRYRGSRFFHLISTSAASGPLSNPSYLHLPPPETFATGTLFFRPLGH